MIIHVAGTLCSGKTTIIEEIRRNALSPISCWDIKTDFHLKHGTIVNGRLDFEKYAKVTSLIEKDIMDFLFHNCNKLCIIESSGFNTHVNLAIIRLAPSVKEIYLEVPAELDQYATRRGEDIESVRKFAEKYETFVARNNVVLYSPTQARRALALAERYRNVQKFGDSVIPPSDIM